MSGRKPSIWRKRAVKRVVDRDGATCGQCGCDDRPVARAGGAHGSFDRGDYCCIVYITSCLELDHRLPLTEGGSNDDANLWLLCVDCHKAKTIAERSARCALARAA